MADNEALDESATGTSDDGGGGDPGDFSQSPPPAQQTAPQNGNTAPQAAPQPQNGAQAPPSPQTPPPAPKVTGKAAFMGNLLRTILSGVQNSTGNPNNAFDRGFQQASPQVQQQKQAQQQMQQAQISKAQSEADTAKIQTSLTGMKALQTEYLLKRLPQEDQEKHLEQISNFKNALIKEGADVVAEGDDEKASDAQAAQMNSNDPRSTSHAGKFYSLPSTSADGKPKWETVYVPSKETLQKDYTYKDSNGDEQTIPAGTPMYGAMGKFVENLQKNVQGDTKEQHKQMGDALKPNIPEGEINQTVEWLKNQQTQNTPLYQQNKAAVDGQIKSLKSAQATTQSQKLAQAEASARTKQAASLAGKDTIVHTDKGDVLMSGKEAEESGETDYSTLSTKMAQEIKDKRANADASMDAMTTYQKTFNDSADKLTSKDRDALRVLTSHVQESAGSGVLGNLIEELPIAGPLSSYANKLASGTMTSDQYKQLSPEGKELLAKYSMAVVANFANMKQMLGSVGRNPAMIQAEMGQIPLPYIDKQSGNSAFSTKIADLTKRNASIPKVYKKPQKDSSE